MNDLLFIACSQVAKHYYRICVYMYICTKCQTIGLHEGDYKERKYCASLLMSQDCLANI